MEQGISPDEMEQMRRLGSMGSMNASRTVDDPRDLPDDAELIHMTDVVEMQKLLLLAADELERLYSLKP